MADEGDVAALAAAAAGHFAGGAEEGRGVHRGRRRRAQPAVRLGRQCHHHVAVAMSLFHLYAAIAGAWPFSDFPIIPTQPLRYAHVAFVLILSFLLFPMATRFRNRIRWWDVVLRLIGAPRSWSMPSKAARISPTAPPSPTQLDICARRDLHRAAARGDAPHHRLDRAGDRARASSPTPISGRTCRSPGRIAASTSASSSAICSSRSRASSAFRSTCRRR